MRGEVTGADAQKAQAEADKTGVIIKKVKKDGEYLHMFLQSRDINALQTSRAQRIAYDARLDHGFESAGIQQCTSTYCVDMQKNDEDDLPGLQVPHTKEALTDINFRKEDRAYECMVTLQRSLR